MKYLTFKRGNRLALVVLAIFGFVSTLSLGIASATSAVSSWFDSNTIRRQNVLELSMKVQKPFVVEARRQVPAYLETTKTEHVECSWSRECVESYIEAVGGDDGRFIDWAKFTARHEGGYRDQWSQYNSADSHSNGQTGSWGQFQFGEGTYSDHCEASANWKMDWRAQTRCAKKIWDRSYELAKNTWWVNTNRWEQENNLALRR